VVRRGGCSRGGDVPDNQWITVTMDNGLSFVVGGGWSLPPGYPNFSMTWIEMIGTEGSVFVDDSHRDVVLNTMKDGMRLPLSSMPGEFVDHSYAGPMKAETVHFLEAVACDRPVLVTPDGNAYAIRLTGEEDDVSRFGIARVAARDKKETVSSESQCAGVSSVRERRRAPLRPMTGESSRPPEPAPRPPGLNVDRAGKR